MNDPTKVEILHNTLPSIKFQNLPPLLPPRRLTSSLLGNFLNATPSKSNGLFVALVTTTILP